MDLVLRTARLILRPWREADDEAFAALFDDPRVMEFLLPSSRADIAAFIGRIRRGFVDNGFGLWAVEVPGIAPFIGYVGLSVPRFEAPFMPAVEIGWRLASAHWGKGYATEGARAALAAGFTRFGLGEIVSFTVPANTRSIRVMERIGMTRDPAEDFDHPRVPDGHRLKRHVLYRLSKQRWGQRNASNSGA